MVRIKELVDKVARMKINLIATDEELELLGVKYAGQEPELVWSEVIANIGFNYGPMTIGTDNIQVIVIQAKIRAEPDIVASASGAGKVH